MLSLIRLRTISLTRATFENAVYFRLRSVSASILLILLHPHSPPPPPPPSPPSSTVFRYKGKISKLHVLPTRLFSFVLRLYSSVPPGMSLPSGFCTPFVLVCIPLVLVCTAWHVVPLGFLYSVCTRLYSFVFRLYSFVPPGMLFPQNICIPFVFVCTLTPFSEYNTIRRREGYKSTKCAQM